MLALAPGFGQTAIQKKPPAARRIAPPDKWPIRTLAVEGNRVYSPEEVLSAAGLRVGDVAGKPEFDAAHDRLLATGAFSTVGYKYDVRADGSGSDAGFQVTENETLPVVFYGLGVPAADLEASLAARDPLFSATRLASTEEVIARWTAWIQEYLAARHLDSRIMGGVEPWPEKLSIVFRAAKNLPAVAEVSFQGNRLFTQTELQHAVSAAAVGAPYTEGNFRMILDASIRPVYEAKGRMRVTFPEVRATPVSDVLGLRVFVTVDEGEVYNFGKFSLAAPTPLPAEDVLRCFEVRSGDTANFDRVKEGLRKVHELFRHAGYLGVQAGAERNIHDAGKTVDVSIRVDAGPRYVMGKLEIVGLDLNAEAEIKRIWGIGSGSPFDPDYPQRFLDGVRREGMFDNLGKTNPATHIDEKTHTADVTLTFAGANPAPGNANRVRRQ